VPLDNWGHGAEQGVNGRGGSANQAWLSSQIL